MAILSPLSIAASVAPVAATGVLIQEPGVLAQELGVLTQELGVLTQELAARQTRLPKFLPWIRPKSPRLLWVRLAHTTFL